MRNKSLPFHHYCKTHSSSLGFKKTRGCYLRIVNDVYQAFTIHFFAGASPECTIRFSIRPLCERMIVPFAEDYDLFALDNQSRRLTAGWNVCTSDERLDYSDVFAQMELRLFPLFQKADNCAHALDELSIIESEIENNRLAYLRDNGITDMAASFRERSLLSESKLFMALKSHDYTYAAEALELFLANLDNYRPAYQEEILLFSKLIERKDCSSIDSILLKNEQYSRKHLTL